MEFHPNNSATGAIAVIAMGEMLDVNLDVNDVETQCMHTEAHST